MKSFSFLVLWVAALGLLQAQPPMPPDPPEPPEYELEEWYVEVPDLWAMVQTPQPPSPPAPPAPRIVHAGTGSYLGIGVAEINAERAKALKLAEERGVEVTRVERDSPAEKAGLKEGDVVLEYNGQRVEGTEQFVRLVRETPPGRQAKLLISRNGATQTVAATVGRRKPVVYWERDFRRDMDRLREDLGRLRMPDMPQPFMSWRSSILGVEAESLSTQLAEFFGVKEGVLVRSVHKDTPAEKAGFKAGDVITKVDGEAVRTPSEVSSRLRASRDKRTFPVTVVRNRQEMTLTVTLEEERSGEQRAPRPRPRTVATPKEFKL